MLSQSESNGIGSDVGSEDFGETLNEDGETKNGPNTNEPPTTTEKKDSRSYATVARGTKRFVRPE